MFNESIYYSPIEFPGSSGGNPGNVKVKSPKTSICIQNKYQLPRVKGQGRLVAPVYMYMKQLL